MHIFHIHTTSLMQNLNFNKVTPKSSHWLKSWFYMCDHNTRSRVRTTKNKHLRLKQTLSLTQQHVMGNIRRTTEQTIIEALFSGWLVVFNVPSTARSFRDSTSIYCPLQRT